MQLIGAESTDTELDATSDLDTFKMQPTDVADGDHGLDERRRRFKVDIEEGETLYGFPCPRAGMSMRRAGDVNRGKDDGADGRDCGEHNPQLFRCDGKRAPRACAVDGERREECA